MKIHSRKCFETPKKRIRNPSGNALLGLLASIWAMVCLGLVWSLSGYSAPALGGNGQGQEIAGSSAASLSGATLKLGLPRREASGWRIPWKSEPGRRYVLQRWHGEDLGRSGQPSWIEAGRVVATGEESSAVDPSGDAAARRYYRVVRLPEEGAQGSDATGAGIRLQSPSALGNGGWRIAWSSVPTVRYELQRWHAEELGRAGNPSWIAVTQVVATAAVAAAEDWSGDAVKARFYRVAALGRDPAPDREGPILAGFRADLLGVTASARVRLSVKATDASGVRAVEFSAGERALGAGRRSAETGDEWVLEIPFREVENAGQLTARGTDELGNGTYASVRAPGLAASGGRFVALDEAGRPSGTAALELEAGVELPSVEYRPARSRRGGAERGLVIKLAPGAMLMESGGRQTLRFREAELRFGKESALRFGVPSDEPGALALGASEGVRAGNLFAARPGVSVTNGAVRIVSANPVELPVGAVSAADFEVLLGLQPGEGVPLVVFDRFAIRWHEGFLEEEGIRGGRFGFEGLPLPALSGDYGDQIVAIAGEEEFRLPYYGEFDLGGAPGSGKGALARARVGPLDPAWLILRADGSMAYHNRAEFRLPLGVTFRADVTLDDPVYRMQIFSAGAYLPVLDQLGEIFSADAGACLPGGLAPSGLDAAARCLAAFDQSYSLFAASAAAAAAIPEGTASGAEAPATPPDNVDTALSLLEAWSFAEETPLAVSLPFAALREVFGNSGKSAAAARDLAAVCRYRTVLARALVTAEKSGVDNSDEAKAAKAALDGAFAGAEAAVLARLSEPDAVRQLTSLRAALRAAADARTLLGLINRQASSGLHEGLAKLTWRFLKEDLQALGVAAGQYVAGPGSAIAGMERLELLSNIRQVTEVLVVARSLGGGGADEGPHAEGLTQMGARLWTRLEGALEEAEAARDIEGFQSAFAALLDLEMERRKTVFPSRAELAMIPRPGAPAWGALLGRLGALYELEAALGPGLAGTTQLSAGEVNRMKQLLRLARESGDGAVFPRGPFERDYERLGNALGEAMSGVEEMFNLRELGTLLEAGILHERLRADFNLPSAGNWEGSRLPLVTARLALLAGGKRSWWDLSRVFGVLYAESERVKGDAARRAIYLEQCLKVVNAARLAAVELWQIERGQRAVDAFLRGADISLPGEMRVRNAAGQAVYDHASGVFGGGFSGELILPNFDGALEIGNASFDTSGAVDLSAFGGLTFNNVSLSASRRQPLRFQFRPPGEVRMGGEVTLTLPSGVSFAARVSLDDPTYGFRVEARDIQWGLARELAVMRPTADLSQLAAAGESSRRAWVEYWGSLSGALEALAGAAADLPDPDLSGIGEPPDYAAPALTIPFSGLNAFANSVLLDAQRGVERSYGATIGEARAALSTWRQDGELAAKAFKEEGEFLKIQLQRLEQQRKVVEALDAENWPEARDLAAAEAALHADYLAKNPPRSLVELTRHARALTDFAVVQQIGLSDLEDLDADGIPNALDPCPSAKPEAGESHADADNDGIGDECDPAPNDAAIPGAGPCGDYIRLAGRPEQQMKGLLQCRLPEEYAALGLDFNTGGVVNQAVFEGHGAAELEFRLVLLTHVAGQAEGVGVGGGALEGAHRSIHRRLLELKLAELEALPSENILRRYELALDIADLRAAHGMKAADAGDYDAALRAAIPELGSVTMTDLERLDDQIEARKRDREKRLDEALAREMGTEFGGELETLDQARKRGVAGDTLVLIKVLFANDAQRSAVYRERMDDYVRYKTGRLQEELIDPQFLSDRLEDGEVWARRLADFAGWAGEFLPNDPGFFQQLGVALEDLTARFTAVAEARRAWWRLQRYELILHEAVRDYEGRLNPAFIELLRRAFGSAVMASGRVAESLLAAVNSIGTEEFRLRLPGDLRVRRAFGGLEYNRETRVWTGNLGGRVEFPEVENAFFEIHNAVLATDGTFQIAGATSGPLPFGNLRLTSTLNLAGGIAGLETITGSGQLLVPWNTSTQLYNVTLGYDFDAKRLRFDSSAGGFQLRVAEDLVLFDGGVGLDISLAEPAGALRFRGSAGLFATARPLPELLTRTDFHLLVTNASARLAFDAAGFTTTLDGGTLMLPEFFRTSLCATNAILTNYLASPQGTNSVLTNFVSLAAAQGGAVAVPAPAPGTYGASVSLTPFAPIVARTQFEPASFTLSGAVDFRDVGFQLPGFDEVELAVCRARLMLSEGSAPVLTNFFGALRFPLPGRTNVVEVLDAAWALDGFPTGAIRLRTNLDLFESDGWRWTLLGAESLACPSGTGITMGRGTNGGTFLRLDGGVELATPEDLFSDEGGGGVAAAACGSLWVPFDAAPRLAVEGLTLSNNWVRLGGTNGMALTNMVLRVAGLTNLFQASAQRPVEAALTGGLIIGPSSGLGLSNAVFRFEGGPLPRFSVSELSVIQPGAIFGLNEFLPMTLEEGRLRFLRDDLSLTRLFHPTNLMVVISGGVSLPPGANPVLGSRVRELAVTFSPNGTPQFSLNAIGFTVDLAQLLGTDIPLLSLGGDLFIGGLNDAPNFLFAGKLKGKFKGNAVEGLVALDACGLRGICFGLAGSEINVPIGYGFVVTGAKGGVSFANGNQNPCEFLTFLPIEPVTGRPLGGSVCGIEIPTNCPPLLTWEELSARAAMNRAAPGSELALEGDSGSNAAYAEDLSGGADGPLVSLSAGAAAPSAFPCPGECPPASVNILCQPHPDQGKAGSPHADRVIMKFTAVNEESLNGIGITREFVSSLTPRFSVDKKSVAMDLARLLRGYADSITPRAPADAPDWVREAGEALETQLNELELAFANALYCVVDPLPAGSAEAANLLYEAVREAAWAGVPCPDATVLLQGSVSYTGVASFADVSGAILMSSTGSAGVIGSVNVLGIPVGQARVFLNQTDANGNPTAALCGEVEAGIGPLVLGTMAALEDCPGCFDKLTAAFGGLGAALGNAYAYELMARTYPELADPNLTAAQQLARLTTPELQMGFVSNLAQWPPRDTRGQVAPAFIDFMAGLANAYSPRFVLCGEVSPKLFGFPLSGGGRLYNARFYSGPKFVDGVREEGYLMFAEYGFSPSQMFAYTLLSAAGGVGAVLGMLAPAVDEASASMTFELPPLGDLAREFFTTPVTQIAARRFEDLLANAVTTFQYRLAPLGMELGRASGRILMPSLEHHPRGPNPRLAPEARGQGLPGAVEVLLAALGDKDATNAVNRLGDGVWKGEGDADFAEIFAGSNFAGAVAGRRLSLRDDYFPHGGFLGAGTMDLPRLLTAPVPESLGTLLAEDTPAAGRLAALQDFIFNHLLATDRVGEISFYLPAPNPPVAEFPTDAAELARVFENFLPDDPLQFRSYYPLDRAFLEGWLDTPVLGIPTVRSRVSWQPRAGLFRMDAEAPVNSWFNRMIGTARFSIDMRASTNASGPVAAAFASASNQVARLRANTPALEREMAGIIAALPGQLARELPKIAMELEVSRVRIPVPAYAPNGPLLAVQTAATIDGALLGAYSPYYNRAGATGDNPVDIARRDGGFAIRGDFNFMNGLVAVAGAEFSVTPNPAPLGLPRLNASFTSGTLNLFGIPWGAPLAAAPALARQTIARPPPSGPLVEFESGPERVRLTARGAIDEFRLGRVFALKPISGNRINASALFETTTSALPKGSLSLGPVRIETPLFAPGASAWLHGAATNAPFAISAEGPWTASMTVVGGAGEGLNLTGANGERVLRLTRTAAGQAQPFRGTVSGDGAGYAKVEFTNLGLGAVLQTYPDAPIGDARRRSFTFAPGAVISLSADSAGAFSLDARVDAGLTLAATPLGAFESGFRLLLDNDGLRFRGSAGGGLWGLLGGGGLEVEAEVLRTGYEFSARGALPALRFGIFTIDDGRGNGPEATVTASSIRAGAGQTLRVNAPLVETGALVLPGFSFDADGAMRVVWESPFRYDGRSLQRPSLVFERASTGAAKLDVNGGVPPVALAGFGSIQPVSGAELRLALALRSDGAADLKMDAALLRLDALGVTVDGRLHGADGLTAPFGFSFRGPWSASATFNSFIGDPPAFGGVNPPELIRLSPAGSNAALFTGTVAGDGGNLASMQASRTGNVALEILRGSPMGRTFNNADAGTARFVLTNAPRRLTVSLDPPDWTVATNIFTGNSLTTVSLFRLSSGELAAQLGAAGEERSLKLVSPALTLLPGSFLEQTLGNLPTAALEADQFRLHPGNPSSVLSFPGLPSATISQGASPRIHLTPAGFSSANVTAGARDYAGLLSWPAGQTMEELSFSGTTLRLRKNTSPALTVLGRSFGASGAASFEVTTFGGLSATFQASANPARNLGFSLLGFQPDGELRLSGNPSAANPNFRVSGQFSLHLAYPNPANLAQTLTARRDFPFDLAAGQAFEAEFSGGLPSFDLGWAEVDRGGDGKAAVSRDAGTGEFSLGFEDWDIYLFGTKFNNQTMAAGANGALTVSLAETAFALGSGASEMRLGSGGSIGFTWRAAPSGAGVGQIEVDLPNPSLRFANLSGLLGTLNTGLSLGSGFPNLGTSGVFDYMFNRSITVNGLSMGSCSARFKRAAANGPIEFSASRADVLGLPGLDFRVSANTGSATSFESALEGTFGLGGFSFGSVDLSLDVGDPTYPFHGTATINNVTNLGLKLGPAGVQFLWNGVTRSLPLP